jgi:hypothetical protein
MPSTSDTGYPLWLARKEETGEQHAEARAERVSAQRKRERPWVTQSMPGQRAPAEDTSSPEDETTAADDPPRALQK